MMKDRQVEQTPANARIPVISTALHCVSMTVLVFLRGGFGYAYLRPRSIFIALSWAFILFCVFAWNEPAVWSRNWPLCAFGIAAIALYFWHLTAAFGSELRGNATHDHNSGTPHTLRIAELAGLSVPPQFRSFWIIWAEPAFLACAGAAGLMAGQPAKTLSAWLLLTAPALWLKEALNYWFNLRQRKRQRDAMDDAKEGLGSTDHAQEKDMPAPTRKPKVRRSRAH